MLVEPETDHGFLLASTGSQLYFHRDSVTRGRFEDLKPSTLVHYVEEDGHAGPVATRCASRSARKPDPSRRDGAGESCRGGKEPASLSAVAKETASRSQRVLTSPADPPDQRSPKDGQASQSKPRPGTSRAERVRDAAPNTDEQGRQANVKQNTTNQGYQQDR